MAAKLGLRAKAYRLTTGSRASWGAADSNGFASGPAPANLDELTQVRNVTLPITDGKADVSVRGFSGFRASIPALTDADITIEMVYDPADTDYLALMKAKIGKTTIALAFLDDDKATIGTIGFWADFYVFGVEKGEELEEGQMVTFTVSPALTSVAPEWVKVTA